MLTLDMIGSSETELEDAVICHCSQFGTVTSAIVNLPADQIGYAAALSGLSESELEEVVIYRGSQLGTVKNAMLKLPADQIGYAFALVRMSAADELDKVFVNLGDSRFGSTVIIRLEHGVKSIPAPPKSVAGPRSEGKEREQPCAPRGAIEILLVEDNPADVRMTKEALKAAGVTHRLHVVEDGLDAIAFLRQEKPFSSAPSPGLVLLDLNIPKVSGYQVLREIKTNDHLKHIPVVVLTNSKAELDIRMSRQADADRFVTKLAGLNAFAEEMKKVEALAVR